jgi:Fic family protein
VGADEDHCAPGKLRERDENVDFGSPRHRGAEGGEECKRAFSELCRALREEFRGHDPLVQALALHYHLAAMHPFQDGNGRTARALEALMLQRVGLKDTLFIAMSNYYYEEKTEYLKALASVRASSNDLTDFLVFGLRGVQLQCDKLFQEIRKNLSKALYRNVMFDLFTRLKSERKRVIAQRQLELLKLFLESERLDLRDIQNKTLSSYKSLRNPYKALIRDLNYLLELKAIRFEKLKEDYRLYIRLEWPMEITESEFFRKVKEMPKSKTSDFLSSFG